MGFRIPLSRAVLSPLHPQARNVQFATATVVAATTHHLAAHSHYVKRVRGMVGSVNDVRICEKPIVTNRILDARTQTVVMNRRKTGLVADALTFGRRARINRPHSANARSQSIDAGSVRAAQTEVCVT